MSPVHSGPRTSVNDALCRLDGEDRLVFVNDALAALLGHSAQALLGQPLWDVLSEADAPGLRSATKRARTEREVVSAQSDFARPDHPLDLRVYPDGAGLLVHLRDTHERQLAEVRAHRLQAVTEALAGALTLPEVVEVVLEAATPASDADAGALVLLSEDGRHLDLLGQQGYPPEVAGVFTRVPLEANTPLTHAVRDGEALYLSHGQLLARYPHLDHGGPVGDPATRAVLPLIAGGETLGAWQLTFPEGTTLGEAERGFIETLARLCTLALARARIHADMERAVRACTLKLQEQSSDMRAYADAVSRNLAPSLRRIRDFADVLSRRLLPHLGPDEGRFFEHIQTEGERMASLIEDLDAFVASGQGRVPYANVPLGQLVTSVRADLAPLLRQRSVVWKVHDLPTVRGNAPLLRQAFAALLSNAVKFTRTREVAVVEVGARREEHASVVWVRDNGVGFRPEQAAVLFHLPGAWSPAREGDPPTGLGLANVRRIAAKHGGQAWAQGQSEEGATFFLRLPDHPAPREE